MENIEYRAMAPELTIRAATGGDHDGRIVEGIAVPYGRRQRINDELTEVFVQGAFAHQLNAAHRVKFTRNHLSHSGEVIGRALELREDPAGLWGAFLVSRTPLGLATLELVRDRALDELSIGFMQPRGGSQRLADGTIQRTKVNLFEVSLVADGAYGQTAKVLATRSDAEQAGLKQQRREWVDRARRALPPVPDEIAASG